MAPTVDLAPASTGRLDLWRDLIRDHFVSLDVDAPRPDGFRGQVRTVELGDLRVAEVASIPQSAHRTAALARADATRWFQIGLLTGGAARLTQDGRECELRPGDFALYETDRPFTWDLGHGTDPWRLLVFTWPRAAVDLTETEAVDLTARQLAGGDGFSGVVSRMLRDLAGNAPAIARDPRADAADLARRVAGLAVTAAGTVRPAPPPADARLRARIEAYLRANLADPALSPETIAAAHFISTRHLHRLFAGTGRTVGQWLRAERLDRARHDLVTGRGGVAEISRRWGFSDPAVFSRAFKAAYGTAPSRHLPGSG
ncbi:helix-turn-helix domain-containing protein [Sporichthya polymorpha]|uniref:AraC-like ligand-binding domain-containing protein n=1 Tax=Sporichthya polymorpha TaxID=35751 RepID=UPI00036C2B6A|nr:helix-turn-helix domain-containing protein [Sporichthya polymorpha]